MALIKNTRTFLIHIGSQFLCSYIYSLLKIYSVFSRFTSSSIRFLCFGTLCKVLLKSRTRCQKTGSFLLFCSSDGLVRCRKFGNVAFRPCDVQLLSHNDISLKEVGRGYYCE
uniref:Uncharacterized protein n=1 Tax=Cacopsylla melanoneura TaxID=428564 RepID=A0A8D8T7I8_9HEMI